MDAENVVLTALKKAEDSNGLVFRLYEWAGKTGNVAVHLPKGATGARLTNLMEKPEGDSLKLDNGIVTVPVHPYEIVTVLVDYPEAK